MEIPKFESFEEDIRSLERKQFPEFDRNSIYAPPKSRYMYFSPSWHFNSGLLTPKIVRDLKDNKTRLLSVGSGQAHLERFLVKHFGICPRQIVLSDEEQTMPEGFEQHIFDMYNQWPKFNSLFDYVIFPESVLLNCKGYDHIGLQRGLQHLLEQALIITNPMGEIRITGHNQSNINIDAVKCELYKVHSSIDLSYDSRIIVLERRSN